MPIQVHRHLTSSPAAAPGAAAPSAAALHSRQQVRALGADAVRTLVLMLLSAVVALGAVLAHWAVEHWADGDLFMAGAMTWTVVLSSLLLLTRPAGWLIEAGLSALDRWSAQVARSRAQRRLGRMATQPRSSTSAAPAPQPTR